MDIYVGNLPYATGDEELKELFSQYGDVERATVVMDRETGRSRGFGFVGMPDSSQGQEAIDKLHESKLEDRSIIVNQARPRTDRPRH